MSLHAIQCPHCGQTYELQDQQLGQYLGREVPCDLCRRPFLVVRDQERVRAIVPPPMPGPAGVFVPQYAQPTHSPASNGLAITGLVFGILGIVTCGLLSIPGLIFSVLGLNKSNRINGAGRQLALAGLIISLTIFAAAFLIAILLPQLGRPRETANRVKCASNLRSIGHAMLLYANENRQAYPRTLAESYADSGHSNHFTDALATGPGTGRDADDPFDGDHPVGRNNIPAALFLLIRTQEIGIEVFTCSSANDEKDPFMENGTPVTAQQRSNFSDLGRHLSYSYANPYPSTEAAEKGYHLHMDLPAEFAVMADMNPGCNGTQSNIFAPANAKAPKSQQRQANSPNHGQKGQNVLFGDGHVEFVLTPWVGVNQDNIYTRSDGGTDPNTVGSDATGLSPLDASDSVLLPARGPLVIP